MKTEMIADVFEALEKLKELKPVYEAILKFTKDKKQALDAIKLIVRLNNEYEIEAK